MRYLAFLQLLFSSLLCSGQTHQKEIIQLYDQSIHNVSSFIKQDSFLQLSIIKAKKYAPEMAVPLLQFRSFVKQQQNQFDDALQIANEAVEFAQKSKLDKKVIYRDALSNLALCYIYAGLYDSAKLIVDRGFLLAKLEKDTFNLSILLTLKALHFAWKKVDFDLNPVFDSAAYLATFTESRHDDVMAASNHFGYLQEEKNRDYKKAIDILLNTQSYIDDPTLDKVTTKAYERMPFHFRKSKTTIYFLLATVLGDVGDYDNGIAYVERVVESYKQEKNFAYLPYVYSYLTEALTNRNEYERIVALHDSVKTMANKMFGKPELPFYPFYFTEGWIKLREKKFEQAKSNFKKAIQNQQPAHYPSLLGLLDIAIASNDLTGADSFVRSLVNFQNVYPKTFSIQLLKLRSELEKKKGNTNHSTNLLLKYYALNDSLTQASRYYTLKEAETRFKVIEKENNLKLLNQVALSQKNEIVSKQNSIIILLISLLVVVIILFILYKTYRQKEKQTIWLNEKNKQIELLIRELHHRVKNNLQTISSLLSLQSIKVEDDRAKAALKEGQSRVDAMALIHQKLYIDDDLRGVDMEEYLQALIASLASAHGYKTEIVTQQINMKSKTLDVDLAIPLGLIINELVINSFKHAFHHISHPALLVRIEENNNQLEVNIADNGIGLKDPENLQSKSFGFKLVKTLVQQLKATLIAKNNNGTSFLITLPLTAK